MKLHSVKTDQLKKPHKKSHQCYTELKYHIAQMVHAQCKPEDVAILIVLLNVLLIGQPHNVLLQVLFAGLVALAVCVLPQIPLFHVLISGTLQVCTQTKVHTATAEEQQTA